jgi:hypothetical protein
MALCKEIDKISSSRSHAFDKVLRPGNEVVHEGIYRCVGCSSEMVALGGKPLPGPKQHPHAANCAEQRWQLLVGLSH